MADTPTNPQQLLDHMAADPAFYRSRLRIEVSGEVRSYADVAATWQLSDFAAMDPAWLRCAGRTTEPVKPMRAWKERPRGASKTADLAIMACWALAFASFPVRLIWASGDRDQARLGRDAIRRLCQLNPWLGAMLTVNQYMVRNDNTGAELEIMSSDAATAFGQLVDGILIDEVGNWPDTESAQNLWNVLVSTAMKKQNCYVDVITNAGRVDSWQWERREKIREDGNWYFHSLAEIPSWITQEQLAEQMRLLPPNEYARTCLNKWTSGTESGLSPADLEACCTLTGPQMCRESKYNLYLAACDLGWRHDRTGLVVLAVNLREWKIALACCASWHPQDYGGELPLEVVEHAIETIHRRYELDQLLFDPREATGLSQRLVQRGLPCYRAKLDPAMQNDMAKYLLQSFNQRSIGLYRHPELIRDLLSLEVVDRTIGLKLQAARSSGGHSDLGFAFAMCNYIAQQALEGYSLEPTPELLLA